MDAAHGQQELTAVKAPAKAAKTNVKAGRLLIVSTGAGSMTPELQAKLRSEFSDHLIIDFDPKQDFEELITPRAPVIVAGGDGTVEFVVRKLADSRHPMGILPLGTFNNFPKALGIPIDIDRAIAVAKTGRPRAITLGRVNEHIFLEACAIGLFGETIALGDSAKDMQFGELAGRLGDVISARPFRYELSGDITGSGRAMSLVFSNTASIGSNLPVSDTSPVEPYLEFTVHAGHSRTDIVRRAVAAAVLKRKADDIGQVFRFKKIAIKAAPRVRIYADNFLVGRTPAVITAEVSAVKVLLPK
jgi:diacylglycerol kinase family enzyme